MEVAKRIGSETACVGRAMGRAGYRGPLPRGVGLPGPAIHRDFSTAGGRWPANRRAGDCRPEATARFCGCGSPGAGGIVGPAGCQDRAAHHRLPCSRFGNLSAGSRTAFPGDRQLGARAHDLLRSRRRLRLRQPGMAQLHGKKHERRTGGRLAGSPPSRPSGNHPGSLLDGVPNAQAVPGKGPDAALRRRIPVGTRSSLSALPRRWRVCRNGGVHYRHHRSAPLRGGTAETGAVCRRDCRNRGVAVFHPGPSRPHRAPVRAGTAADAAR